MSLLLCVLLAASDPWVFVRDAQRTNMSGSLRDLEKAMKYQKKFGGGYLWFRHDGAEYVIRDGKLVKQIDEAVRPGEPTAEAEAELDLRQQQIEKQQARLEQHEEELEQYESDDPGLARAKRDVRRAQAELEEAQKKLSLAQEKLDGENERLSRQTEDKMALLIDRALHDGLAIEVGR
jgi:hypothetical protein